MFKAMNPYMLVAMEQIPVSDIIPGPTPDQTRLVIDLKKGAGPELRTWSEVAGIRHFEVKINGRSRGIRSLAEILLEFAQWIEAEIADWKDPISVRPWDPDDELRQWFSPYLKVAKVAELRSALADDIVLLKGMTGSAR